MPSLSDATQPRDTSNLDLITRTAPIRQPSVEASADPEFSALSLAPIPPLLGTDTDLSRQFYRRNVSQLRMPPLPTQSKIAVGASSQSQIIVQVASGGGSPSAPSGIDLQVNNVDNPIQGILNITGSGVSYGPGKGQVQIEAFGNYQLVQGHGVSKPVEPILNFLSPMVVADNPGNTSTDISVPVMVGDSGSGGVAGLVPAPGAGDTAAGDFLKADGTWAVPPGTGGAANYQTVQNNGVSQPAEPKLNFIGATVADNPGNSSTDITVSNAFKVEYFNATPSLVQNTNTETTLMTFTVPANEMSSGQALDIVARGTFENHTGGPVNYNFKLYLDSTVVLSTGGAGLSSTSTTTSFPWNFQALYMIVASGALGTMECQGWGSYNFAGGTPTLTGSTPLTATVNYDTTATHVIKVTVTMDTASLNAFATQRQMLINRIGP